MPNINRSDAQQRADEIGVFNRELARLEAEQVLRLSDSQRASLHGYQQQLLNSYLEAFDIDHNIQARQLSLGMRIASFLGALALAASVFFSVLSILGAVRHPEPSGDSTDSEHRFAGLDAMGATPR